MKYILILIVSQMSTGTLDYVPVPGAWTKQECTDGGINWQKRAIKGSTFMCIAMGKDPDQLR
jgi:hypothetical protein